MQQPFQSMSKLYELSLHVLTSGGLSEAHARSVARTMVLAERDACPIHGVIRLRACIETALGGRLKLDPRPVFREVSSSIVKCDADLGFSTLAFELALDTLVEKASLHGLAALVINRCFHFSPLWPEVEALAERGLAAIALTPSHSWVAPCGGSKPVFGTNPIAFAWPRKDKQPFVFDFATSALARVDLQAYARSGTALPPNCAVDEHGEATTDAEKALHGSMLPFGAHKGSALAAMVELLAGSLIGDLSSAQSMDFDGGRGDIPLHGELILAFNPATFGGEQAEAGCASAEAMFTAICDQGARLPSQRRFQARERSIREGGVAVPAETLTEVEALLDEMRSKQRSAY